MFHLILHTLTYHLNKDISSYIFGIYSHMLYDGLNTCIDEFFIKRLNNSLFKHFVYECSKTYYIQCYSCWRSCMIVYTITYIRVNVYNQLSEHLSTRDHQLCLECYKKIGFHHNWYIDRSQLLAILSRHQIEPFKIEIDRS